MTIYSTTHVSMDRYGYPCIYYTVTTALYDSIMYNMYMYMYMNMYTCTHTHYFILPFF